MSILKEPFKAVVRGDERQCLRNVLQSPRPDWAVRAQTIVYVPREAFIHAPTRHKTFIVRALWDRGEHRWSLVERSLYVKPRRGDIRPVCHLPYKWLWKGRRFKREHATP